MLRRLSGLVLALALFAVAACDRPAGQSSLPTQAAATSVPGVRAAGYRSNGSTYYVTLLASSEAGSTRTASQVIGSRGGKIYLYGGSLTVPAQAVSQDTKFTFTLKTAPYLSADLKAVKVSDGSPVTTFQTPLTLRLDYSRSATPIANLQDLSIYWVQDGVILEQLKSVVDRRSQNVWAFLNHFSEYSPGLDAAE
jgi:hypothetical protein